MCQLVCCTHNVYDVWKAIRRYSAFTFDCQSFNVPHKTIDLNVVVADVCVYRWSDQRSRYMMRRGLKKSSQPAHIRITQIYTQRRHNLFNLAITFVFNRGPVCVYTVLFILLVFALICKRAALSSCIRGFCARGSSAKEE